MTTQDQDKIYQERLTPLQYRVARQGGTEQPFTGLYWNSKDQGSYDCVCCGAALFVSSDKYDSRSGWPSFTRPAEGANIVELRDNSLGMARVEVQCGNCDAHLGHVFPDGPGPEGQRYCINSASLEFEES